MQDFSAFVSWPSAPLTNSLVSKALDRLSTPPKLVDSPQGHTRLLQWSTYDDIDHDLTHSEAGVLASSYTIRKALIRKHYLARCIHAYTTKHTTSKLVRSVPRSWDIEISFADELEDMWTDELWDLAQNMAPERWWILKPGMADRGMGIRLFNSQDDLQRIFEEFEGDSDEEDDEGEGATAVVTSQLRHFVIQEYIPNPLLMDPNDIPLQPLSGSDNGKSRQGHKFHLRAYCVASGALTVYLYTRILALFSAVPYTTPTPQDGKHGADIDLTPHLTNTSLQAHRGEEGVRLLDELAGHRVYSTPSRDDGVTTTLKEEDIADIKDQISAILGETFKAAQATPIHFQALPNAFELFGIDFLVSDNSGSVSSESPDDQSKFQVHLLEVNSEPAIELTGPRLHWILEDLFVSIGKVCVEPFFGDHSVEDWNLNETRFYLRKCLDVEQMYR
ncbi:tubulin-tyrosine ligase [Punctularia strigosozonata HHB-11173 SS5]|uniref:tubulin-tyrosine ligase n=1 Tax=Punctularia strigosozonata (strain HHB-11173) TaxID=741275 RepID=UPI0004417046|nr:tubulin-tyrosine ligase [Punctularia strigosozonata HHB-11173 SS5]EIN13498.1 tubulin-tyrosine ligase [Punctularia strigosozonata HHB-11173 SS5]